MATAYSPSYNQYNQVPTPSSNQPTPVVGPFGSTTAPTVGSNQNVQPKAVTTSADARTNYGAAKTVLGQAEQNIQNQLVVKGQNQATAQANDPIIGPAMSAVPFETLVKNSPASAYYRNFGVKPTPEQLQAFITSNQPPVPPSKTPIADALAENIRGTTATNGVTGSNGEQLTVTGGAGTNTIDDERQKAYEEFSNNIKQIQEGTFPLSQGQLASLQDIRNTYDRAIKAQEASNKAYESGLVNVGIARGSKYAPEIYSGIQQGAINAGLQKVADLNSEATSTINALRASFIKDDYQKISDLYDRYNAHLDERQKALDKVADDTRAFEKAAQDSVRQTQETQAESERDTAIADLYDQGVTDVSAILHSLNYDKSGNQIGGATAKQVSDSLKYLAPSENMAGLSPDYRTFLALQKAGDPSVKGLSWLQYQQAVSNATRKLSSSGGSGQGGGVSNITKSIIANPSLFDDLTPTIKGQVISDLQTNGYSTTNLGVKGLSDTAITHIAQTQSAISNLQSLKEIINNNTDKLGPITGFSYLNPYSESRKIQADVDRVRQVVGKALEGGVLRKEDEDKYKKILATLTDTPSTALYKIDALINSIQRDMETYKSLQQSSGRSIDVSAPLTQGNNTPQDNLRTKYAY